MSAAHSSPSISLDFASVIRRRWPLVLLGCLLSGLLAALYWCVATRVYESSVEIMVMKKDPALTSVSEPRPSDGRSDVMDDVMATHIRMLGSRRVIADAIESHDLGDLPGIQPYLDKETTVEDYIVDQLFVGRGGKGEAADAQVLRARFRHTDEEETQQILAAIVESYQSFLAEASSEVGSQAFALFEQSRDRLSDNLKKAESEYAEFRQTAPVVFSASGGPDLFEQQLAELLQKKSRLEQQRSAVESRLELVRNSMEGPNADQFSDSDRLALVDESHVERLALLVNVERGNAVSESFQADQPARTEKANVEFDRLVSLQLEADEIESKFGPRHPKLANLAESIAGLEEVLQNGATRDEFHDRDVRPADVVETYVTLLENDMKHLDRQLADMDLHIEKTRTAAKEANQLALKDRTLLANLERKQEVYSAVVARLPELAMTTQFGGYDTEIIAPVSLADTAWPDLLQLGSLALALGLCAGLGGALYADANDRNFRSSKQVAELLGLPVLGVISKLKGRKRNQSEKFDSNLVNAVAPESIDAQTIRIVRTALMFAGSKNEGQAIQFTSPTPSDGVSLIAGNVAVALASAGKRVVLLDADLRRPSLGKLFGVQADMGLSELLSDSTNLPDVLCPTGIENLDLLPAGNCPANPAELLSMPRFTELLDTLRDQFDYVIVDTPPLLAVSDPLSVAQEVEGVILIVPIKPDSIPAAEHAVSLLDRFEANVIGTVVNDLEDRWANTSNPLAYRYSQAHAVYADVVPSSEKLAVASQNGQSH